MLGSAIPLATNQAELSKRNIAPGTLYDMCNKLLPLDDTVLQRFTFSSGSRTQSPSKGMSSVMICLSRRVRSDGDF